jgi:DNA-binding transcriptional LysR family regulator
MLNDIDLSRIDLNLLVLFEAVHATRHVGRAADRLALSPSAVSHGLGRLRRLFADPLFLRTPKGVVPTVRAIELASPIAEILAGVRQMLAKAEPFDAASSTRRFTVSAPDGVSAVFLPALFRRLCRDAPGIDVAIRQLLPTRGGTTTQAWETALADLENGSVDVVVGPLEEPPARFLASTLYEEDFVVAMRAGHAFAADPSLARYCREKHLVVSQTGDPQGFVDAILAEQGLVRRVALTAPNFAMAAAIAAETDLVTALPRRFAALIAGRFDLAIAEAPVTVPRFPIRALASRAAMADAGVAWLFGLLEAVTAPPEDPVAADG